MAGGKKPAFTIKVSNKDGSPREFTDYKGNEVSNKYEKIGVLFENQFGGFNLALEKEITLNPDAVFVSVFPNDQDDRGRGRQAQGGGQSRGRQSQRTDDNGDDEIPF